MQNTDEDSNEPQKCLNLIGEGTTGVKGQVTAQQTTTVGEHEDLMLNANSSLKVHCVVFFQYFISIFISILLYHS